LLFKWQAVHLGNDSLSHQGQMTAPRLVTLLRSLGIIISKR
jgi:hypothetical protein